ncbi:MAG: hypothetical protein WCR27_00150 [Eubacteriales bacterium]
MRSAAVATVMDDLVQHCHGGQGAAAMEGTICRIAVLWQVDLPQIQYDII